MITSVYLHHSSAAIMKFSLCWLVEEKRITRVLFKKPSLSMSGAFCRFMFYFFMMSVSEASGTEALVHTRSWLASNRLLIAADKFTRELKHVLMELWDYVLLACVSLMTCKCRITTCAIEMEHLSHRTLLLLLIPVSMHPSDTHLGYSVQKVHLNKKYYVYNFLY